MVLNGPIKKMFDALSTRLRDVERRLSKFPSRWPPSAPVQLVNIRAFVISGRLQDSPYTRYIYSGQKLGRKSTTGYGSTWDVDENDDATYLLYNSAEDTNGQSGLYGNGVRQENIDALNDSGGGTDGTIALQPIPTFAVVYAIEETTADGNKEWWIINMPNGVDGTCPVPP